MSESGVTFIHFVFLRIEFVTSFFLDDFLLLLVIPGTLNVLLILNFFQILLLHLLKEVLQKTELHVCLELRNTSLRLEGDVLIVKLLLLDQYIAHCVLDLQVHHCVLVSGAFVGRLLFETPLL